MSPNTPPNTASDEIDHLAGEYVRGNLSQATRETIVLHHLADMSVHEVAETLGVPVGTVKARLSRGRAMLASLLSDAEPTTNPPVAPPANPPRHKPAPNEQEVRDAG